MSATFYCDGCGEMKDDKVVPMVVVEGEKEPRCEECYLEGEENYN